jgi:site-specific DNA recombinase
MLEYRRSELTAKIKKLYNLYASSGNEILLETIQENQRELESIEKILANEIKIREELNSIYDDRELIKNLRHKWDKLTMKEKHNAIRLCIEKIIITDGEIKVSYLV